MKFLTTVKPGPMPPPPEVARAAQEWLQAALDDGWIECCYAYPHGGGCSISEVDSHEELMDRLLDYPMSPFVDYEVTPLVELDAAFDKLISFIERAAAGAGAGA
jgi:muconolactone delta-isomerase